MPLLINRRLNAREAFFILHLWLEAQDLLTVCGPILDQIRITGTHGIAAAPGAATCYTGASEPGPLFRLEPQLTVYT